MNSQEIKLMVFYFLATIVVGGILMYRWYVRRVVVENSKRLAAILDLNDKIRFYSTIRSEYQFNARVSRARDVANFDCEGFLVKKMMPELEEYQNAYKISRYNWVMHEIYTRKLQDLPPLTMREEMPQLPIPVSYKRFLNTEAALVDGMVVSPVISIEVVCRVFCRVSKEQVLEVKRRYPLSEIIDMIEAYRGGPMRRQQIDIEMHRFAEQTRGQYGMTTRADQSGYCGKSKIVTIEENLQAVTVGRAKKRIYRGAALQRKKMTQSMRYDVLKRDNFRCTICGRGQEDGVKLHVDHIRPVSKGGKTVMENLRTLCSDCNLGKRDKYDEDGEN